MAGQVLVVSDLDERTVFEFGLWYLFGWGQKLWEHLLGVLDVSHSILFFFHEGFKWLCYDAENGREYLSCMEISESLLGSL
jgi:hypothetical protein